MAHAEQVSPSHLCVARCRTYPDISGQNRTYPDSPTSWGKKGSSRAVSSVAGSRAVSSVAGSRVVRLVTYRIVRRRITCGQARRVPYGPSPDRVPSSSSRAVSPVAGHDMRDGRRVPYRPSPDRVPYGSSLDHVSPYLGPCRRPRCPCRRHGRAIRTSVACHAPAQQPPVADAARSGLRTSILMYGRGVLVWPRRRRG